LVHFAAAQDHMAVGVATGLEDGRGAHLGQAHEGCAPRLRRQDRIWRRLCTPPSVPFLKPTGQLRPLASWRWLWLSVVRAPMAPQADRGRLMNCGAQQVQELGAHRHRPIAPASSSSSVACAFRSPSLMRKAAVQVRVVDVALPADRGTRLLEVHAHHHQQLAGLSSAGELLSAGLA
jgi:hypothetical protein